MKNAPHFFESLLEISMRITILPFSHAIHIRPELKIQ